MDCDRLQAFLEKTNKLEFIFTPFKKLYFFY